MNGKLNDDQKRRWKKWINRLKTELPTDKPVVIRTQKISTNDLGFFSNEPDHYYIAISKTSSWNERVDTLIHEYAHALDHEGVTAGLLKEKHHSESWGIYYAKCYSLLFD